MKKKLQVVVNKLSSLFSLLEYHNIPKQSFLKLFRLDPLLFNNPANKVSLDLMHHMIHKAAEITGDSQIGLHMGEQAPKISNILWYMMMNCSTLYEASMKYYKYQKIIDNSIFTELKEKKNLIHFRATIMDNSLKKDLHLSDVILSSMMHFPVQLTGHKITAKKAYFTHKRPGILSEYEKIFRCPLIFDADINCLVIDKTIMETPIIAPNKELLNLLQKYAQDILDKITIEESYTKKVNRLIMNMLDGGVPSINAIAKQLTISTRNIQLKLKEEGTTYTTLLNNIRKEQAVYFLKDKKLSIAEVSYLLGFSEPSVFHRKFKQWTGSTPGNFRKIKKSSSEDHIS